MTSIIFVTGHWHTSFHAQPLLKVLRDRDATAQAVQLASVGRKEPRPEFKDDVSLIRDAVQAELDNGKDVLLVLHSYAGMPGAEATNQLIASGALDRVNGKGQLIRVLFIAAYVFPAGQVADAKNFIGPHDPHFSIDFEKGINLFADPYAGFFNDMSKEEAQPFLDALDITYYLGDGPLVTSETWRQVSSTYVICEQDQAVPLARQEGLAAGMQRQVRINAAHSPYVSQPEKVAEILLEAANS